MHGIVERNARRDWAEASPATLISAASIISYSMEGDSRYQDTALSLLELAVNKAKTSHNAGTPAVLGKALSTFAWSSYGFPKEWCQPELSRRAAAGVTDLLALPEQSIRTNDAEIPERMHAATAAIRYAYGADGGDIQGDTLKTTQPVFLREASKTGSRTLKDYLSKFTDRHRYSDSPATMFATACAEELLDMQIRPSIKLAPGLLARLFSWAADRDRPSPVQTAAKKSIGTALQESLGLQTNAFASQLHGVN